MDLSDSELSAVEEAEEEDNTMQIDEVRRKPSIARSHSIKSDTSLSDLSDLSDFENEDLEDVKPMSPKLEPAHYGTTSTPKQIIEKGKASLSVPATTQSLLKPARTRHMLAAEAALYAMLPPATAGSDSPLTDVEPEEPPKNSSPGMAVTSTPKRPTKTRRSIPTPTKSAITPRTANEREVKATESMARMIELASTMKFESIEDLTDGEIVWAKLAISPTWPAEVCMDEERDIPDAVYNSKPVPESKSKTKASIDPAVLVQWYPHGREHW